MWGSASAAMAARPALPAPSSTRFMVLPLRGSALFEPCCCCCCCCCGCCCSFSCCCCCCCGGGGGGGCCCCPRWHPSCATGTGASPKSNRCPAQGRRVVAHVAALPATAQPLWSKEVSCAPCTTSMANKWAPRRWWQRQSACSAWPRPISHPALQAPSTPDHALAPSRPAALPHARAPHL